MPENTTTVTFDVTVGDVWVDADNTSWYVKSLGADTVYLERTVIEMRSYRDLVRKSRKMGEPA